MSYPSLKNFSLIIIAIILVAGAILLVNYRNKNSAPHTFENPNAAISVSEREIEAVQGLDTDGDGLRDWEEVLWGTDALTLDTDGDGTGDGDEVTSSRDPLVKGPNDKVSLFGAKGTASTSQNLTVTDKFGRDIFARYIELKQAGLSSDIESQQEIVRELIENGDFLVYPKVYTTEDITVVDAYDSASLRVYGNQIGAVFQKNMVSARDEGYIVKDSIEKNDPNILKELDPIIESDRRIVAGLASIAVPKVAVRSHLDLLNAMSGVMFVAQSLRQSATDPVVALQGIGRYQETALKLFNAMQQLKTMFSLSFVTFTEGEPGYVFSASLPKQQ